MIIKNGTLINPETKEMYPADLILEDGKIYSIDRDCKLSKATKESTGEEVIDAKGLMIAPGLIDTHVHFRDPGFTYKEDIHTGALASAKGGFTSVVCMANTNPTIDSVEVLEEVLKKAQKENIHIYQAASVSYSLKGEKLTDMEELKAHGACGFTDDGIPLLDAKFCYEAMEAAAKLEVPLSLHEEDPAFISNNGINQGEISEKLGVKGSPALAEEVLVARDSMMALHTGLDLVIQHISSGNSVALVRNAKALGAHIHAEATPHHFTLNHEALLEHGSLAKMNPPLREEKDRLQIIEGLKDGTIDLIATDHAPHSEEEKARELTKAPSGIIGLETSLALGITSLVEPGYLSLPELLEKMTINPAKLYKLPAGRMEENAPADLVIFDPKESWTPTEYASKSRNSPFTRRSLTGKVHYTICNGELVYQSSI